MGCLRRDVTVCVCMFVVYVCVYTCIARVNLKINVPISRQLFLAFNMVHVCECVYV